MSERIVDLMAALEKSLAEAKAAASSRGGSAPSAANPAGAMPPAPSGLTLDLEAIRRRVEAAERGLRCPHEVTIGEWHVAAVASAWDVPALLAEVERLREEAFGGWDPDSSALAVVTGYLLSAPEQGEWSWMDHCEGLASGILNALHQSGTKSGGGRTSDRPRPARRRHRRGLVMAVSLDEIRIGSTVWSVAERGDGSAARGGCVVDFGIGEGTAEPYLLVLDEAAAKVVVQSRPVGGRQLRNLRPARLVKLRLPELQDEVEPPSTARMHGWARKGLLGAALGATGRGGELSDQDLELARLSLALVAESREMQL